MGQAQAREEDEEDMPKERLACSLAPGYGGESIEALQSNNAGHCSFVSSLPAPPAPTECGSCNGCLANNGVCYPETKLFCDLYPQYTWCGARRLSGSLRR